MPQLDLAILLVGRILTPLFITRTVISVYIKTLNNDLADKVKLFKNAVVKPKWELFCSVDTKLADNAGGLHSKAKGNWDKYRNECVRWGSKEIPKFIARLKI